MWRDGTALPWSRRPALEEAACPALESRLRNLPVSGVQVITTLRGWPLTGHSRSPSHRHIAWVLRWLCALHAIRQQSSRRHEQGTSAHFTFNP